MAKFTGVGTKGVGQVYDGPQFKKWSDWTVGEEFTGKYLGRTEKSDKYGKFGFVVQGEHETLALNSTGLLEKKFPHIQEGQEVLVRYKGKSKISKGKWAGQMAHNVELFVAGDETVEDDDDI